MGAEITGTGVLKSGGSPDGVGDLDITIPADANCIDFSVAGYRAGQIVTALNFDNLGAVDFTLVHRASYSGTPQGESYYATSATPGWPGPGSHKIYYAIPGVTEGEEGPWVFAQCIRNVNTASPIGDSVTGDDGGSNPWVASLPGAVADDLAYGFSSGYLTQGDMTGNGQTQIASSGNFDNMEISAGYKVASTDFSMSGDQASLVKGAHVYKGVGVVTGLPIDINGSQATDVNIDGNAVSAIYLGSTQLWP